MTNDTQAPFEYVSIGKYLCAREPVKNTEIILDSAVESVFKRRKKVL